MTRKFWFQKRMTFFEHFVVLVVFCSLLATRPHPVLAMVIIVVTSVLARAVGNAEARRDGWD